MDSILGALGRIKLALALACILIYGSATAGKWVEAQVELRDGQTLQTKLKLEEDFLEGIEVERGGEKVRLLLAEVKSFTYQNHKWRVFEKEIDRRKFYAAFEELVPGFWQGKYEELKCSCNNSFQVRTATVIQMQKRFVWLEKRLIPNKLHDRDEVVEVIRVVNMSRKNLDLPLLPLPELKQNYTDYVMAIKLVWGDNKIYQEP